MPEKKETPIRSFGRIKARTLKPRQQTLIETLLPKIAVPEEGAIELDALFPSPRGEGAGGGVSLDAPEEDAPGSAPSSFTPPPNPLPSRGGGVMLEIGFGAGEHLAAQAAAHPGARFIGVEPFLNGVGACLAKIDAEGLSNVRLHAGDARDVVSRLPGASLDRVYILFPDPWPKARHHKRRLIQPAFVAELARVLKPGGELRFATDWEDYANWTLAMLERAPGFAWTAEAADDWRKPWPSHVTTRYETKGLGDCAPIYLRFSRLSQV